MSQGDYNIEAKITNWSMITVLFRHVLDICLSPIRKKAKYYVSIYDCPIGVFQQVLEKGSYHLLCYDGKLGEDELNEVWLKIYAEYIDTFNVPDKYKKYMSLMEKWAITQEKIWIKGQKHLKSFATIYKAEAESMLTGIKSEFHETLAHVSKIMRFQIPLTTTVYEFYGYVKAIEKNGKEG